MVNDIKDLHFALSKRIMTNAFTGNIIYASQREGKSSYALQCLYDIYGNWDDVFEHTFFKLEDIIQFLKHAVTHDEIIPVILWDDASVYGGSGLWFKSRDKAGYLQALLDTIGSKVRGILFTTPNPGNLLKSVRSYEFLRTKIIKSDSRGGRIAKGYKNIMLPSTSRRISRNYEDRFNVQLPDDVYKRYNVMRKSYLVEAIANLEKCMQNDEDGMIGIGIKEQGEDVIET